jgi:hypothetical protein
MQQQIYEPVAMPAHVPSERVYDFDFFTPPGAADDIQLAWKRLHEASLDAWLELISEFGLAPGTKPELHAGASNNGILRLELAWDAASSG